MTAVQQAQPPRFLGEGTVDKIYKRHMFVEDSKYGRIYVPLDAAQPCKPDVFDLREIFTVGDDVVLTAIRQQQKQQECNYCACSIVHRSELKSVQGRIVEMLDKYAYVDVPKVGRIFAPFSARTDGARFWHGKNANVGKIVTMKILPQPEFHKCCFVAFAVYPDRPLMVPETKDDGLNNFNAKCDRQPESVLKQLGMIVIEPNNTDEGLIYAQTTGSIAFSRSLLNGVKFEAGDFVLIDAIKKVSNHHDKCFWSATHIELIGGLPCIKSDVIPNRFNPSENCVTVDVYAIVCRSSHSNSSIWLWNDLLGRIFVNNHHYINDLHAMDVVTVKAQFTAAFEDVPWSAISVRPVHENVDQLREQYGQLMVTDDNWKVLHVCEQTTGGFFGFMEHPTKGAAFMAWTDLNFGEVPPTKNAICRVTVYNQHRDRRHPWRAILVTQLDPENRKPVHEHPMHGTTGQLHYSIQAQIRQHKSVKQPIPVPANGNVWTVPSATVTTPRIIAQHQTSSSNTSIDSGRASSGLINDSIATTPIDHPPGFNSAPLNTPIGAERLGLSPSQGNQNMAMAEVLKKKAQTDTAVEEYEKFLCDEMLRRPHLLMKLISSDLDAQQLLISLMKQKQLNSNSTAI
ncbi:hypothetical protein FO519_001564 [Halicephalobus sp. NKZ332]|nr:hypothetical protein FO519_001564 [Halicephalobus sp. NKZ332]